MSEAGNFITYFNGEWVKYKEVSISPDDRGFVLGDVVFDIARTFGGKPFVLDRHLDRLYRSLQYMRINPEIEKNKMRLLCEEAVQLNDHQLPKYGDFTIHPFVTRGVGVGVGGLSPTVCISVKPVNFASFSKFYDEGVDSVITRVKSYSSETMDPKVKHHSRGNFVLAELEANDRSKDTLPILLDIDGNVSEGIGYNVFMVKDGVLKTPLDKNILQGIARSVILDLAAQAELPCVECDIQPYDLYTADEVFFTRTSPRIIPVSTVDGRQIGDGKPGVMTRNLLAAHSELVDVDIVGQAKYYSETQS